MAGREDWVVVGGGEFDGHCVREFRMQSGRGMMMYSYSNMSPSVGRLMRAKLSKVKSYIP